MAKLWIGLVIVVALGFLGGMLYSMKKEADYENNEMFKIAPGKFRKVAKDSSKVRHTIDSLQHVLDSLTANKNK